MMRQFPRLSAISRSLVRTGSVACALVLLAQAPAAAADIRIVRQGSGGDPWSVIQLTGRIERGDADRLAAARGQLPERDDFSFIRLLLDSPGGDYVEAFRLGKYVNAELVTTRIGAGKSCVGACALVFLAGADWSNGAEDSWLPQRELEAGGRLELEGLTRSAAMSDALGSAGTGDSLLGAIYRYLRAAKVDAQLFEDLVSLRPAEHLPINKADQLRRLEVHLIGARPAGLTEQSIVNLCNWATGWRRPLSFTPDDPQAPKAEVTSLSYVEFKRALLLASLNGIEKEGALASHIRTVAEHGDAAALDALYQEATDLHILRLYSLPKSNRFYRVTGFDFGGGFYTTSCSVSLDPGEAGKKAPSAELVEGELIDDIPGTVHSFRARGDVLYELYARDAVLP